MRKSLVSVLVTLLVGIGISFGCLDICGWFEPDPMYGTIDLSMVEERFDRALSLLEVIRSPDCCDFTKVDELQGCLLLIGMSPGDIGTSYDELKSLFEQIINRCVSEPMYHLEIS